MKKITFGVFAVLLALGFTAFRTAVKFTTVRFEYAGPNFQKPNVEDPAKYTPGSTLTCNASDKACQITVDIRDTKNGLGDELDPAKVVITASDPDANTHFAISSVSAPNSATWGNQQ